jgi:hypothetical protein
MSQIVSPFGAAELNGLLGFDLLHRQITVRVPSSIGSLEFRSNRPESKS